ncbi:MAG: hypothetical protein P8J87_19335, partial [Verrucomicrobiales bacterium]|nr:hypothetical protein [Verrucomicrobiales bacterium]
MKIAKHHPVLLAAIASLATTGTPATAQQTALTESQAAVIIKQLEALQLTLNGSKESNNSKALAAFAQAATSSKLALGLYLSCVKEQSFVKQEKRESEFRDWKKRSEDFHKSLEFQLVLRMQLLYLIATIEASEADEIKDALPAVETFVTFYLQIDKLLQYPEDLKRGTGRLRDFASSGILGSAFAEHYKLDATVTPAAGWPMDPTDINELFDGVLLPLYRDEKTTP